MFKDVNQSITDIKQSIAQLDTRITSLETYDTTNTILIERIKVLEEKYPQITINSNEITNIKIELIISMLNMKIYIGLKAYNE